jgi:hypothetical protein
MASSACNDMNRPAPAQRVAFCAGVDRAHAESIATPQGSSDAGAGGAVRLAARLGAAATLADRRRGAGGGFERRWPAICAGRARGWVGLPEAGLAVAAGGPASHTAIGNGSRSA